MGLLETILEYRAFASAKETYQNAKDAKDLPDHPLIDLVKTIEFELVHEELKDDDPDAGS